MRTPFALSQPVIKPRFLSSLGIKMLAVSALLLILSFSLCSAGLMILTRRMLQDNLESMVKQHSRFLGAVSQGLVANPNTANKQSLSRLAKDLLREPEIVAVAVLDVSRRVIVQ